MVELREKARALRLERRVRLQLLANGLRRLLEGIGGRGIGVRAREAAKLLLKLVLVLVTEVVDELLGATGDPLDVPHEAVDLGTHVAERQLRLVDGAPDR